MSPELFREGNLAVRPITNDEVTMITCRDLYGFTYPYIAYVDAHHSNKQALGVAINDQLVGYAVGGIFEQRGKKFAEVGMAHVSPQVRGYGLGSILNDSLSLRLMANKPDVMYAEQGDQTGKVAHMLEKLGYKQQGKSNDIESRPLWFRYLTSDSDRADLQRQLDTQISTHLKALSSQQDLLVEKALQTDRDNPRRKDIVNTVNARLASTTMFKDRSAQYIFGYRGAPVTLIRSCFEDGLGASIRLDMEGIIPDQVSEVLCQQPATDVFTVTPTYSYTHHQDIGTTVSTPYSFDGSFLKRAAQRFAQTAKEIIHPSHG